MDKKFYGARLVVGLGNPGREYENTYHNAGALLTDFLSKKFAEKYGVQTESRGKLFESVRTAGIVFIKPLAYMNENGKVVRNALKTFGEKTDTIVVAHDDSDIELGDYKVSFGRNPAGHRGVQSVIEYLGTKDFWRIRIGVRRKAAGDQKPKTRRSKAGKFVLKKISAADRKTLESVFEKIYEKLADALPASI